MFDSKNKLKILSKYILFYFYDREVIKTIQNDLLFLITKKTQLNVWQNVIYLITFTIVLINLS